MASLPELSLDAGLAALKQENYQEAIAHLEGIAAFFSDENAVLRAQMGLVVAYERTGKVPKAMAICQNLTENSQVRVQQWANKNLAILTKRYPDVAENQRNTKHKEKDKQAEDLSDSQSSIPKPKVQPNWRQAGRAQRWNALKPLKLKSFWLLQAGTAIAFLWVLSTIVRFAMETVNNILVRVPFGRPIDPFYRDPTQALVVVLGVLLCLSPWLIEGLLKFFYGLKPLSIQDLATHSPESDKVLNRFCRQNKFPVPKLGILPTSAPVAMTYGNLRRNARIVVSQGLLEQLTDEEIATIYAGQLGHIIHWDFVLMSLIMLVLQLGYITYWQVSQWGDLIELKIKNNRLKKFDFYRFKVMFFLAAGVSALSYSIYWLLRWPSLWFSRARISYSDRIAAEITGNPNGFTRALLKIAIGIAQDIQQNGSTSWLLESFDLLMPLGYKQAISLGSCYPNTSFESILSWDCIHPYRDWLVINYSHPLTGDRIYSLSRYAKYWKLDAEINLETVNPHPHSFAKRFTKLLQNYKALPILQSALIYGLAIGIGLKSLLWIIGWIGDWLGIWQLIWLHQPNTILPGGFLFGFSLSIFIEINRYFPDIKLVTAHTESAITDLYTNQNASPTDSQPVRFSGKLLGRKGMSNWLGQDLILEAPTGLIKLNFFSRLGTLGNIWNRSIRPINLLEQQVNISGWFRRGVIPWIDLETLRNQSGKTIRADYPIWVTIIGCASAVWGAYIIWQSRG